MGEIKELAVVPVTDHVKIIVSWSPRTTCQSDGQSLQYPDTASQNTVVNRLNVL
jgi:hypothetical protein